MNYPMIQDDSWREAYRMHETARLEEQTPDLNRHLEQERLTALSYEAIERRWAKQNPRTAMRMKTLLRLRFLEDQTHEECGVVLDVSRERVRQMEVQLLQTIREHLCRLGVKP